MSDEPFTAADLILAMSDLRSPHLMTDIGDTGAMRVILRCDDPAGGDRIERSVDLRADDDSEPLRALVPGYSPPTDDARDVMVPAVDLVIALHQSWGELWIRSAALIVTRVDTRSRPRESYWRPLDPVMMRMPRALRHANAAATALVGWSRGFSRRFPPGSVTPPELADRALDRLLED